MLGVILETVSEKSYAELLEENIFGPLGMKNTHVHNNRTIHKNMATGYQQGLEGYALAGMEEESTRLAAGNILSTVKDLYSFQKILDFEGDNILSEKNKKMLLEPHSPNFSLAGIVMSIPYNNGKDKMTFIRAGGSSYGFRALMDRIIEKDALIAKAVSKYRRFQSIGAQSPQPLWNEELLYHIEEFHNLLDGRLKEFPCILESHLGPRV